MGLSNQERTALKKTAPFAFFNCLDHGQKQLKQLQQGQSLYWHRLQQHLSTSARITTPPALRHHCATNISDLSALRRASAASHCSDHNRTATSAIFSHCPSFKRVCLPHLTTVQHCTYCCTYRYATTFTIHTHVRISSS